MRQKKKLLLIHPMSNETRYFFAESGKAVIFPLWPAVLGALAPAGQWEVTAVDENVDRFNLPPATGTPFPGRAGTCSAGNIYARRGGGPGRGRGSRMSPGR